MRHRAAANPQKLAIELPLTKPATTLSGRPKSCLSHFSTTSSSFAEIGESTYNAVFWSQKSASHRAANPAGTAPPFTNP